MDPTLNTLDSEARSLYSSAPVLPDGTPGAIQVMLDLEGTAPYDNTLPRRKTLFLMLKGLRAFAQDHYQFFSKGFQGVGNVDMARSKIFPPEDALARIEAQIAEDAEIIIRAIQQRTIVRYQGTLGIADGLAYRALNAGANMMGFVSPKTSWGKTYTVLTYFRKSTEIRVIPYLPVALIGIPMSAIGEKRDLLAVAHEVGHYLYHHRQIDPTTNWMNHGYSELPGEIGGWQEEVFADICGGAIAGSVLAYDFQELSKLYPRDVFVSNDSEHPRPCLRPLIYTHLLRVRGNSIVKELANALDMEWGRELVKRWCDTPALVGNTPFANTAPFGQVFDALKTLTAFYLPQEGNANLSADQRYLIRLGKALALMGRNADRPTIGPDVTQLVEQAMARIFCNDEWSIRPELMATDQDTLINNPDQFFVNDHETLVNLPIPELDDYTEGEIARLWRDWIQRERFFDGATPDDILTTLAGAHLPMGVGDDVFDFFKHPVLPPLTGPGPRTWTWQPLWYASSWTTHDPNEGPGRPP